MFAGTSDEELLELVKGINDLWAQVHHRLPDSEYKNRALKKILEAKEDILAGVVEELKR